MNAELKRQIREAVWTGGKIPMDRAYTYCVALTNGGWNRCNNRCQIGDDYCTSCKALRATPKNNSGNSANPGGEKGTASPSNPSGVVALEPPRGGILYEALGPAIAEKLIREAHGLKCSNCGETIGELSDAVTNYGWVHCPEGRSYTYCFPEQNQYELKASPLAEDTETD